jgi:hypothetical protein
MTAQRGTYASICTSSKVDERLLGVGRFLWDYYEREGVKNAIRAVTIVVNNFRMKNNCCTVHHLLSFFRPFRSSTNTYIYINIYCYQGTFVGFVSSTRILLEQLARAGLVRPRQRDGMLQACLGGGVIVCFSHGLFVHDCVFCCGCDKATLEKCQHSWYAFQIYRSRVLRIAAAFYYSVLLQLCLQRLGVQTTPVQVASPYVGILHPTEQLLGLSNSVRGLPF